MAKNEKDLKKADVEELRAADLPVDVDYSKSETTKPADPDTGLAMPQVTKDQTSRVMTTENTLEGSTPAEQKKDKVDEGKLIRDYESGAKNYDQLAEEHDVPVERVTAILERHSAENAKKLDEKESK